MALESSGTISIGGSTTNRSINLELGRSATATSSLNESDLRTLANVSSGTISLSDFHGKSSQYVIERSLRFNKPDNPYSERSMGYPTTSGIWTLSCWIKRTNISTETTIFSARDGNNAVQLYFPSDDRLRFYDDAGRDMYTNAKLRDPGAWYHIVVTRTRTVNSIYINGVLDNSTTFSSSYNSIANKHNCKHSLGRLYYVNSSATDFHGDFYLADPHFIDGQALAPTNFGETDDDGVWQPIEFSGTYGSNGWHYTFENNSNTTNLGLDSSGNGRNTTLYNISVAAGAGNDSLRDSPTSPSGQTDSGAGGTVKGNYPTWNSIDHVGIAFAEGNLQATVSGGGSNGAYGSMGVRSGKYYWEITPITIVDSGMMLGVGDLDQAINDRTWTDPHGWAYHSNNGNLYNNTSNSSFGSSYSAGDVIGFAVNMDNGTVTVYKNGSSQGTITGLSGKCIAPYIGTNSSYNGQKAVINFGQRAFTHSAPTGYKCLCSSNLPNPAVADGSTAFDATLWTGNGSTQTISGLGFSPDLVWYKCRSSSSNKHGMFDIVRGASKQLYPASTNAEATYSGVSAFNSNGFNLGNDNGGNQSSQTYVGWAWDAGSSTVSNTDGSITSQVRANQTSGFSIVTWSGNSTTTATVGHGLSVKPSMILLKSLNASQDWGVYHKVNVKKLLQLNHAYNLWNSAADYWYDVPTTSVFYPDNTNGDHYQNATGKNYVAYCFAPVDGFSAFGTYIGNSSSIGPFAYTGFRPKFVMIKATGPGYVGYGNWVMHDTTRSTYNESKRNLYANANHQDDTTYHLDILSNGFKIRSAFYDGHNGNNIKYVFAAFAEHPLKSARAR